MANFKMLVRRVPVGIMLLAWTPQMCKKATSACALICTMEVIVNMARRKSLEYLIYITQTLKDSSENSDAYLSENCNHKLLFIKMWNQRLIITNSQVRKETSLLVSTNDQNFPSKDIIRLSNVNHDIGNNYDVATGGFTAPVDGIYQFSNSIRMEGDWSAFFFHVDTLPVRNCWTRASTVYHEALLKAGQAV